MSEIPQDLIKRLLRTETLAMLAGIGLFLSGEVESIEEGVVAASGIVALIIGRSVVKAKGGS
jgi:hypothetical protein